MSAVSDMLYFYWLALLELQKETTGNEVCLLNHQKDITIPHVNATTYIGVSISDKTNNKGLGNECCIQKPNTSSEI